MLIVMNKGEKHLHTVNEKLGEKISQMSEHIEEIQKDIENMNEYYWQNYTEMDQYGYENYDNQRALFTQVNANQENQKTLLRLKKMQDSPFFGSVEFLYEGEDTAEEFYIGIGNFAERTGSLPLIYDWRAPVSGLFYDFDKGPASYQAPGGRMEGDILSKWQYKIRNGNMIYGFESDVKIDDDVLKQELGSSGDVQLKNIVRTIQKEQNAIIRNTKDKILAIQGAAGSGKTSIALHRIAYLLYHEREWLKSSNVLILSPNSVFSDYISHVLPELGEEHIQEMSFDVFAYHELRDIVFDCEDRYDYIERKIAGASSENFEIFEWKNSEAFIGAVEAYLVFLEDDLMNFKDFEYKGFLKTEKDICELFYYKFSSIPLLSRMQSVMEYVIDEFETLANRQFPDDDKVWIEEFFQSMYETTDIYKIYNGILEENGIQTLEKLSKEQRVLLYEDVYPMLYLKHRLYDLKNNRKDIRHLVIDEMQDYSYLQYVILNQMFSCNMTILGDRLQTLDTDRNDVLKFLPHIFGKKVRTIELLKSYRNTIEIAEYAKQFVDDDKIQYLERHGKPVCIKKMDHIDDAVSYMIHQVEEGGQFYETSAVLVMTEKEAKQIYQLLRENNVKVQYLDRNSSHFEKGLSVTTYYLAKGLEFDQVFVAGGERKSINYPSFQYISATRALHELHVLDW